MPFKINKEQYTTRRTDDITSRIKKHQELLYQCSRLDKKSFIVNHLYTVFASIDSMRINILVLCSLVWKYM
ncbi:MAG: hypothetical protein KAR64_10680, partial [Thermoplasmatales archaeon]|nr:hypothetical protein [Thermoplasmatales archaeon]